MKASSIIMISFGIIIIMAPEIIAYLIGGLFLCIGIIMFFSQLKKSGTSFSKKQDERWDEFVKFWKYKIYR